MRQWIKRLSSVLIVALLGTLFGITPLGFELEQKLGLNWLFHARGPIAPYPDVVVVGIDDQSGPRLGLSKLPREWPRSIHAQLTNALVKRGVSAIVFDFDFQTPKQADDDMAFAKAIADSNRVVLTERLIGKRQPLFDANGQTTGALWVEQLVGPMPMLASAAKGAGTFPLPKLDVAVHEFWVFKRGVEYAPTTPAMALQIHAQKAYPHFIQLMADVGIDATKELPKHFEVSDRAFEVRSLMMKLRQFVEPVFNIEEIVNKIPSLQLDDHMAQLVKALAVLYIGDDHRYLNFYGPPGTITTIPYHRLFESPEGDSGQKLPSLEGKVAFVGYSDLYDPSQPDRFYTVYTNDDGVDLSGVEIAATAFSNLINDQSLKLLQPSAALGILGAFGIVIGALSYLLPAIGSVPTILLLSVGYAYFAQWEFAQHALWLPLAVPMLVQLPLTLFTGLGAQYLSERQKKKRATHAISYYLPEKLAKDFTEKNLESSALNKVTYSVCFASDMAGFTTISEQLPPKELAVFLNDYFDSLSTPLRNNKVDVIEFRADGIMCAWTAESNFNVIRVQAAHAALEAIEAIARFSARHPLLTQHLRIGLEVGMVYVGHSGGGGHFVYSIVGDCANTAARIEGLNKKMGTQILASRNAVQDVENMLTRYLGDFVFVGKTEPLPIVEIMALQQQATEAQVLLCQRYEEALHILASGRLEDAITRLEQIAKDYPEDGPTRFHLAYCQKLLVSEDTPDNPTVIHLDSK